MEESGHRSQVLASWRLATALLLGLADGSKLAAQAAAVTASKSAPPENPEEFSRVGGLFDVDLPKTVEKFHVKVIVHPHFGDLLHRSYLRVPVGVRIGLNEHTEADAEIESYVTHGLKHDRPGTGLYDFHLGAKYEWQHWLKGALESSTGFNTTIPMGDPPVELTDGYYHFAPYVTFSRHWPNNPRLAPFVNLGADLIWKSPVRGQFSENQAHSDATGISTGFLYDAGDFKYTLVASYATTALIGRGSKSFVTLSPSVLWALPRSLTFHSKGQWIFGVGLKAGFGPDGSSFGTSAKLKGEFDLKQFFGLGRAK